MAPEKEKYRFPGLNAYTKKDTKIFTGRKEDSSKLFTKVSLYKTLVLHAESGTGKSSLIQAGLIPLVDDSEENFFPVIIKMNEIVPLNDEDLLVDFVIKKIKRLSGALMPASGFPELDSQPDSLWQLSKLLQMNGKKLLLIFDQFENLQNFSTTQINRFVTELFDLVNTKIPGAINAVLEKKFSETDTDSENYKALNQAYLFLSIPGPARLLFVIREDKLGVMSLLSDYFPDILKNDFIIKPLTRTDAFKAMTEPARAEGEFASVPFKFETDELVNELIDSIADPDTKLVDPIQLQIVASIIEKNIVIKDGKDILVRDDIPKVYDIIARYYKMCWAEVKKQTKLSEQQIANYRKSIVPHLVVGGRRDLVASEKIKTDSGSEKVVTALVKIGILREIPYGKNTFFYQLCHDRLIAPIQKEIIKVKAEDRAKKRENIILYSLLIFIVVLAVGMFLFFRQDAISEFKLKEEKILGVVKVIRTSNPTFAYKVLKDFQQNKFKKTTGEFNKYVAYYDSSNYSFQRGVYPFGNTLIAVDRDTVKSKLTIIDKYSITTWNTKSDLISEQYKLANGYYLARKIINGQQYFLIIDGNLLRIESAGQKFAAVFLASEGGSNTQNTDLSDDGNYVIIGSTVYSTKNPKKPLGSLPPLPRGFPEYTDYEQTSTVFLNDSRHIVIGYGSGYKVVYSIDEHNKYKIRVALIFKPEEGKKDYRITSLATDSKDTFLYAGTGQKTIEVWKLDKLKYADSLFDKFSKGQKYDSAILQNMNIIKPDAVLRGHDDDINSLAVSPNDSLLLSGSNDNTGILWNCNSRKKVSVIKGRKSKVKQAGFFENDMNLYTATDDELLFIWSRESAPALYEKHELARFSPFDYYSAGLGTDDDYKIITDDAKQKSIKDDTILTSKYFVGTLQYIMSIPQSNQDPDDKEYLDNINQSLIEIGRRFDSVTIRKDFSQVISIENRKLFYERYNSLKKLKPELQLKAEKESNGENPEGYDKYYAGYAQQLLFDTSSSDIKTAIDVAKKLQLEGQIYGVSQKYDTAIGYYEKANKLIEAFWHKFNNDKSVAGSLGNNYGGMSYYNLFLKKYKNTISYAEKGLALDSINGDWINTNLAVGYLLSKRFNDAERIYMRYKNKSYNDGGGTFKEGFLSDFNDLEKAGIINKSDTAIANEVIKVKAILNGH